MNRKKLSEKPWFNGAVIACIGVAFYVLLTNFQAVMGALGRFIGFFKPVILGAVLAYVISPLTRRFYFHGFKWMKFGKTRWILSVLLSFVLMLVALNVLLGMLIPQLLQSLITFSENVDDYAQALVTWLEASPLGSMIDLEGLELISENAMASISAFVRNNAGKLLNMAAGYGKNILSLTIAAILAVYILADSRNVLAGIRKFVRLLVSDEAYENFLDFLLHCDTILVNYIVQSLLDATIVGSVTVIFMLICRMPFVGLVSVVVGVTNLIPNFGPIIGGVIGAFILLLVSPMKALMFVAFILVLQFVDGYILKPKLFSNSLGVSGLLILISTIVLGNMAGILGILLAIPTAAVLCFIYTDYFVPWREKKKKEEQ